MPKRESLDTLGPLQRQVMDVVWKLGDATVNQVREELTRERDLAYTTVLSTLQKLQKNGWLKHRTQGRQHVYMPLRTKEQAGRGLLNRIRKTFFKNDPLMMFQHLLHSDRLTEDDFAELQTMIDERRREKNDD